MGNTQPVRIDRELYDDASATASVQSRSAAQQIAHWARIGRAFESSPGVSLERVHRVLNGTLSYDEIDSREQAIVRSEWDRGVEEEIGRLRLDEEFAAEAREYVELDENGEVVVRSPGEDASQAA